MDSVLKLHPHFMLQALNHFKQGFEINKLHEVWLVDYRKN